MKAIEEWLHRLKNKPLQQEKMISRSSENEAKTLMLPHNGTDTEIEIEKAFAEYLKENYEVPDAELTAVAGGNAPVNEERGFARNVANITDTAFRFRIGDRVEVGRFLLLSRSGIITGRYIAKREGTGQFYARYTIQLDSGEAVEKDEGEIYY